jgi:hypothetical protein
LEKYGKLVPSWRLGAITSLLLLTSLAKAAEFSSDIVMTNGNPQTVLSAGKLYVSNDQVRIETPDSQGGFFVSDSTKIIAYFVRPSGKVFMAAKQSSPLTQILVPVDPDNPCEMWEAMAIDAGIGGEEGLWRCNRLGDELIDSRKTIVYSALSARNKKNIVWIDPQLKFLVRSQDETGVVINLTNVQEGPQSASLFDIPAHFSKFDPQKLLEIIKHSDVWVEPSK